MINIDTQYNPANIEAKWQEVWQKNGCFSFDPDSSKPKYYVLEMFPYPSGKIHMGHVRNYTIGDVTARFKKAQGFNILHPMGWDAFGLPAENAAIENKVHPASWTYSNIDNMRKEFQSLGFSFDWSLEFATCSPDYYQYEQKMFIEFLEAGLVYRKESLVNWDPVDQTVLANEQVENGRGWRSGAVVERKKLNQWFFKITDFADELLSELDNLPNWPEAVKSIQKKWIGKSLGANVIFQLSNQEDKIEVFTTTPETLYGGTFLAISPAHPLALKIAETNSEIMDFIKECEKMGTAEEVIETAEKKGIKTGLKAKNPLNDEMLEIYIANFILMEYGTGAIFGCPAHDERDFEFAQKYNLEIRPVMTIPESASYPYMSDDEKMINSGVLNGLDVKKAREVIIDELEKRKLGVAKINYRMRDWGVSRQRYWGAPIPVIHCPKCGIIPVSKSSLPVTLPEDVDFSLPGNPLVRHPSWKNIKCHKCNSDAERETDTFDTFVESSWYFGRFCSVKSGEAISKKLCNKWLPVDRYIGGIEHAAMHLLYARFFTKALKKCGYWDISEPFSSLLTQGMVLHETYKDPKGNWLYPEEAKTRDDIVIGSMEKMSKSKKNLVSPLDIIANYGADAARLFIMSDSPPERDLEWSDKTLQGVSRFIAKLWNFTVKFVQENDLSNLGLPLDSTIKLYRQANKAIADITTHYDKMHFNVAIAVIREFSNEVFAFKPENEQQKSVLMHALSTLVKIINPFCPHLCEELWQMMGNKNMLVEERWPEANLDLLENDSFVLAIQVNGKLRGTLELAKSITEEEVKENALQHVNVKHFIEDKRIIKMIYIPGKVLNVVVN